MVVVSLAGGRGVADVAAVVVVVATARGEHHAQRRAHGERSQSRQPQRVDVQSCASGLRVGLTCASAATMRYGRTLVAVHEPDHGRRPYPRGDGREHAPVLATDDGVRAVYAAHGPELYRFAFRSLGDRGLAEEAVQETFVRAWRAADRFDDALGSLRTWLFAIVRNVVIDLSRARAVRPSARARRDADDVDRPHRRRVRPRAALRGRSRKRCAC